MRPCNLFDTVPDVPYGDGYNEPSGLGDDDDDDDDVYYDDYGDDADGWYE